MDLSIQKIIISIDRSFSLENSTSNTVRRWPWDSAGFFYSFSHSILLSLFTIITTIIQLVCCIHRIVPFAHFKWCKLIFGMLADCCRADGTQTRWPWTLPCLMNTGKRIIYNECIRSSGNLKYRPTLSRWLAVIHQMTMVDGIWLFLAQPAQSSCFAQV